MTRFRRNMTVLARQKLREEVFRRELRLAHSRAEGAHLTEPCRRELVLRMEHPDQARELHRTCKGEEWGGSGCLCPGHDVVTSEVITGTMTVQ